jgi:hypothetical protein
MRMVSSHALIGLTLGLAMLAGASSDALAARPATPAEVAALQAGARAEPLFGANTSRITVTRACISTVERGFAAVILRDPDGATKRDITLFHRNPRLKPAWHMYAFASPRNLWFAPSPTNPYATRLRAEHDLHDGCHLPAWALAGSG